MTGSRLRRINFVEFNAKTNTLGTLMAVFPKYGSLLLASLMRDKGYEVRYFLEGVSDLDFDVITDADVLCLSVFVPALNKVRAFCQRVLQEKPNLTIILGGPQVCFFPETVLDCCSYAVRCEGDEVLPRIIECLNEGLDTHGLPGISYLKDGQAIHNPEGSPPEIPSTMPDTTLIEGFDRVKPLFKRLRVNIHTLQTTRGCRFRCKFCPTNRLFQGVYRRRNVESVVANIKKRFKPQDRCFIVDNDFCSDRQQTRELLQRIIEENIAAGFIIFERHEIGRDPEMLELLRQAGVKVIIVGVESLSDKSLEAFNKKQTHDAVLKSIHNIQAHGMNALSTFVIGHDEDTPESAREIIRFVKQNRLFLNLFILHDLETDESKELLTPLNRRFKTYYDKTAPGNLDYYDYMTGSFVTYFPKRMKPSTLQKLIFEINNEVFSHWNILKNIFSKDLFRSFFGIGFGYSMKRINRNLSRYARKDYIRHLKKIEAGLYDDREVLREEKLAARESLPLPPPVTGFENAPSYRILYLLAMLPAIIRLAFLRWSQKNAMKSTVPSEPTRA